MESKSLAVVEQPQNVQTASVLIIEQFLNDNYRLRRNVLSGKVEFKTVSDTSADYRPLTQEALNSIIIRALREGLRIMGTVLPITATLRIMGTVLPITATLRRRIRRTVLLPLHPWNKSSPSVKECYKGTTTLSG